MSKRPPCPPGAPWMMPMLTVKDVDAALDFYQRAFGIEKRLAMPGPDGRTMHGELGWHGQVIMLGRETPDRPEKAPATSGVPSPIGLYLYCDDVDALFARATKAGAKALTPPENMFWGDRMCRLGDPDGHAWAFATNFEDFDPSKVPH
jgi:PhnB protein